MKGIILAGGVGSRLLPTTRCISKHLLPIYDKPMIYYPLSVLMHAGIKDIILITTKRDLNNYKELFGNGSSLGISIEYIIQDHPNGLPEAFILSEELISGSDCCMILGDNILHGNGLGSKLQSIISKNNGATIIGYHVKDPERFGVIELDETNAIKSIEEKPNNPKSNIAIAGLYFFDKDVSYLSKELIKSARGELEIVDLIHAYHRSNKLSVEVLGRGYSWLDTGTSDSMIEASHFVQAIQHRQGLILGCIEEIAYQSNWISDNQLNDAITRLNGTEYSSYLKSLIATK